MNLGTSTDVVWGEPSPVPVVVPRPAPVERDTSQVEVAFAEPAAAPSPAPAANAVVRGSLWTLGGYGAGQMLRLVGNVVVSRLVFPEAFGVMALVNVFIQGLGMSCDLGIEPNIIQNRRGDEPAFLNTAWTMQVVRGFTLMLGACLLAWPVATFYDEPRFLWLVPIAGLSAVLSGFSSTAIFSARRHLLLGRLTALELSTQTIGLIVMCVWAWLAPGVGALIGGTLVQAAAAMVGSHLLRVGPHNRFAWDADAARSLFHFGKWVFVSTLITFCAMQIDRLTLGKLIPLDELGIYSVAIALAMLPHLLVTSLSWSVLYPLLSRCARESRDELQSRLLAVREALLAAGMILVLGLMLGSRTFFAVLYDARYQEAGLLAELLAGAVWVMVLSTTLDRALQALGDARSLALFNLVKLIATTATSILGFYLAGLPGFIGGLATGAACGHVVLLLCLRAHCIHVARQDARFTTLLMLSASAAIALTLLAERYVPFGREIAATVLLSLAGAWGLSKLKAIKQLKAAA